MGEALSAARLIEFLSGLQAELGGAIPVERYVQEALYHREFGYYSKNIRTVGFRGDFSTTATLGDSLARAVAGWLKEYRVPESGVWHVIEAGAGTGQLALGVLRHLGFFGRRNCAYHIVETSPVLRAEQQKLLARQRNVSWHDSVGNALDECGGVAMVFSNELLDAFAPRLFERRVEGWVEIGIRIEGGNVVEIALDRHVPPSAVFALPHWPIGQRVEVQTSIAEWMLTWVPRLRDGRILTIDYGDELPELYRRRPSGSLRAYFHHQRFQGRDVYLRFGKQDITCDVNFTDIRVWGDVLGLITASYTNQSDFLACFDRSKKSGRDAALSDFMGAGGAFKVLEQVPSPNPETPHKFNLNAVLEGCRTSDLLRAASTRAA